MKFWFEQFENFDNKYPTSELSVLLLWGENSCFQVIGLLLN